MIPKTLVWLLGLLGLFVLVSTELYQSWTARCLAGDIAWVLLHWCTEKQFVQASSNISSWDRKNIAWFSGHWAFHPLKLGRGRPLWWAKPCQLFIGMLWFQVHIQVDIILSPWWKRKSTLCTWSVSRTWRCYHIFHPFSLNYSSEYFIYQLVNIALTRLEFVKFNWNRIHNWNLITAK